MCSVLMSELGFESSAVQFRNACEGSCAKLVSSQRSVAVHLTEIQVSQAKSSEEYGNEGAETGRFVIWLFITI